jgi:hypothetical protein
MSENKSQQNTESDWQDDTLFGSLPSPNLEEAYQLDGNQPLLTLDTHRFDLRLSGVGKSQSVYKLLSFWPHIIHFGSFLVPGQVIWLKVDVIPDVEDSTE